MTTLSTEETEETAPAEASVSAETGEDIFGEIAASVRQTREEYTAAAAEAAGFESAEYELEVERLGIALPSQIEVDVEFTIIPLPEEDSLLDVTKRMASEVNAATNEGEKIGCSLCGKEKKEGYTKSSTEVTNTTVEELIPAAFGPKWIGTSKPIGTKETKTEERSEGKSEGKGETSESGVSGTKSEEKVSTIGTESTGKPSVGASHKEEDESAKSGSSTSLSKATKEESDESESDESESGEGFETETKIRSSSQSFKEKTKTPEGTTEATGTESETTQDIKGHGKGAETEAKTRTKTKTKTHTGSFEDSGAGETFACATIFDKIQCGENGIDEKACLDMDCCWQADPTGLYPSCFKKGST